MVFLLNNCSFFLLIGKSDLIFSACLWKYCLMWPIPVSLPAPPPALLTHQSFSLWFPAWLLNLNQACYLGVVGAFSTCTFGFCKNFLCLLLNLVFIRTLWSSRKKSMNLKIMSCAHDFMVIKILWRKIRVTQYKNVLNFWKFHWKLVFNDT